MVEVAVSRTDAEPEEPDVEEVGPFAADGNRFVLRSAQSGLLSVLADRLRDLRLTDVVGDEAGDGPPRSGERTVFRIARRGPTWLDHPWGVWRDGERCETTVADDYIVPYVLWEVTRLVLERAAPRIPVHAAAVVRDGRALILVGASHSGKSTLSAWLTRAGWGFLSDEVALLDLDADEAVVHPFRRPVGVRRHGPLDEVIDLPGHEAEVLVPASELGALAPPAPLAAIVCPTYLPGAEGPPVALAPAAALATLAPQLPDLATERAADVFHRVAALVERVPAFTVRVDDLDVAELALRRLLDDVPASAIDLSDGVPR